MRSNRATPELPDWIREACFLPHYKNIFDLLEALPPEARQENESRLYCTETLDGFGNWDGPVLFLAKDAGPAEIFENLIRQGDMRPWRAAEERYGDRQGVQTNKNLGGFVRNWSGRGLYGSLLANLLRNDGQQSGSLPGMADPKLLAYLRAVLEFVVDNMSNLRAVVCLGDDAWDHVAEMACGPQSGRPNRAVPVTMHIGGKPLTAFRMFHTSRMFTGGRVVRDAEWQAVGKFIGVI